MPNGKVGDDPYTDIVVHGRGVYSPQADNLVREVAALADDRTQRELAGCLMGEFNERRNPDVQKLERLLTEMRDRLEREAQECGFEP